jgi:hypothetical protein
MIIKKESSGARFQHIVCSNSMLTGKKADNEMSKLVYNFPLFSCDVNIVYFQK